MKIHPEDFKDKVVIITGSSKGIGKATALKFLQAGAKVVLNGRNPDKLNKTAMHFREMGFEILEIAGDVSDFNICKKLVESTVSEFGRIDILINNAGGGFRGIIEETSPEVMKKVIDSNLISAIYCTQAALEEIKKTGGSIVFISSLSGIRGMAMNGPYCVAKMGLTAFAETLKMELHNSGVHIGIIMVGLTDYDEDKTVVSADGSLTPIRRHSHHSREQVAHIIMRTVRKRKFRVVLTRLGIILDFFNRISPSFVEWIMRRSVRSEGFNK